MLKRIKTFFNAPKVRREQARQIEIKLSRAVSDGNISEQELADINSAFYASDIEAETFADIKQRVFNTVLASYMADRRVSGEEVSSLMQIAETINIPRSVLDHAMERVNLYRLLYYAETCPFEDLPTFGRVSIVLRQGEKLYFAAGSNVIEERVVDRQYIAVSQGMSFRIMKGVSYRVGATKGRVHTVKGMVPVSSGTLAVTDRRLVYVGDSKSLNTPFDKLLDVHLYKDGLRFSSTTRQKPVVIEFHNPDLAELAGIYLSRVINQE